MSKSICSGCHGIFNSVGVFDKHRIGEYQKSDGTSSNRQCLTQEQMRDKGLLQNAKGWWIGSEYDASSHSNEGKEAQPVANT